MVAEMTAVEVADRLRTTPGSLVLLDVREPYERQMASIEPSVHIPMNDVPDRLTELPRDRTIVVFCHSGGRSAAVAGYLEQQGFDDVANLTGGIDAWSLHVDPKVERYF